MSTVNYTETIQESSIHGITISAQIYKPTKRNRKTAELSVHKYSQLKEIKQDYCQTAAVSEISKDIKVVKL